MTALLVLLFLLLGAVAGAIHFLAIRRAVALIVGGGAPLAAIGLKVGRMLLTAGVLVAAALRGWPVLLAAIAGFMAARQIVLMRCGGRS